MSGADYAVMRATVLDELRQRFRPEFLNRIDEIVVFHKLTEEQLKEIVEIQLDRVRARLRERRIALEITDAAKTHLVRTGYEPAYGARPLKRAIQREIETPLGRKILAGEVRDGDTVRIDYRSRPRRADLHGRRAAPRPARLPTKSSVKAPHARGPFTCVAGNGWTAMLGRTPILPDIPVSHCFLLEDHS